jgi:hypothetical protein
MANSVKRVYIAVMKESGKGFSYWVQIQRDDEGRISPYMSYKMDQSIYIAAEWAAFFGMEADPIEAMPDIGLTQEMIDAGYKEASLMLEGLQVKDWHF